MINNELIGYIKQQLSLKISREAITVNLKKSGWDDADVNEAFRSIAASMSGKVSTASPVVHSKSKKVLPIIIVLILLCLAGGAAAYAYYTGAFVTLPSLLEGYTTRTETLTSMKIDMNANIDFSEMESMKEEFNSVPFLFGNDKNINFAFVASYDASNKEDLKFSSVISAALGSLSLEAQMIVLSDTMYAKLTKIPDLGFLPIPIMLEPYQDKWFSFLNDKSIIDTSVLDDKFTTEEKNQIEKIFRDGNIINTIVRLPIETIAGESSYHFSFDFDKEAFMVAVESYKNYVESIGKSDPELSDLKLEDLRKSLDQIKDFKGEIWIGRKEKLVNKLSLSFSVQPDIAKDEQIKINMTGVISDYNKPVSIVAPTDSTPFETFISNMMSDSLEGAKEKETKGR